MADDGTDLYDYTTRRQAPQVAVPLTPDEQARITMMQQQQQMLTALNSGVLQNAQPPGGMVGKIFVNQNPWVGLAKTFGGIEGIKAAQGMTPQIAQVQTDAAQRYNTQQNNVWGQLADAVTASKTSGDFGPAMKIAQTNAGIIPGATQYVASLQKQDFDRRQATKAATNVAMEGAPIEQRVTTATSGLPPARPVAAVTAKQNDQGTYGLSTQLPQSPGLDTVPGTGLPLLPAQVTQTPGGYNKFQTGEQRAPNQGVAENQAAVESAKQLSDQATNLRNVATPHVESLQQSIALLNEGAKTGSVQPTIEAAKNLVTSVTGIQLDSRQPLTETLGAQLKAGILAKTGGKLGGGISDADVAFLKSAGASNLQNPDTVRRLLAIDLAVEMRKFSNHNDRMNALQNDPATQYPLALEQQKVAMPQIGDLDPRTAVFYRAALLHHGNTLAAAKEEESINMQEGRPPTNIYYNDQTKETIASFNGGFSFVRIPKGRYSGGH